MKQSLKSRCGMTLLEIMIVVSIIALLLAIALPAFIRARRTTEESEAIAIFRVSSDAFAQYSFFNNGQFPADVAPGVVPAGMAGYLARVKWEEGTSLGGLWDWYPDIPGIGHGVCIINPTAEENRFIKIDEKIDNGDLTSGLFRKLPDGTGYFISIE